MPLLNTADKIYIGAQAADAVYLGAEKVWPSGFDPLSLAGLTIWLDASQTATANPWPNLGSGADPAMEGSPAPVLTPNARNGLPVISLTASVGRYRFTGTGVNKDYTLAYVGRMRGPTPGRLVCASYPAGGNLLFGYWTTYMDVAYVTGGGGFFVPDTRIATTNAWRLYSADCATPAVTPRFFSNGVLMGSHPTPPAADGFGGTFNISGYAATEETCDCDVAEVLLYNRKLPDADRQQVEGYLRSKWAL